MSTYSTRFIVARLAAPNTAMYTAPAAATQVLRDLEITSSGSVACSGFVYVNVSGGPQAVIYQWAALAPQAHLQWEGRAVFEAGDDLVVAVTAGQADAYLSGYNLTL